ncbi:hypothetical protein [Nocardia sp. NBC_01009]|uniref:hypothetical protein n=1 Tax=Nocardia sp. NBC_01009 TaxID=2975996 RepID=UPI00386F8EAB|nr:hypothetical protein OHA42_34010 [Nocardia sp. NBC_01009]
MTTQTHTNAGADRAITDITPRDLGKTITLGVDLSVADTDELRPTLEPTRTVIVDGTRRPSMMNSRRPRTGCSRSPRAGTAKRSPTGSPTRPWPLGDPARGRSDLAHIRPNGEPGAGSTAPGPDVTFHTAAPGSGTYLLHLVSSTVTSSPPSTPPMPDH